MPRLFTLPLCTALLALALATPPWAGEPSSEYLTFGPGAKICHELLRRWDDPTVANFTLAWLTGYLTASNRYLAATYTLTTDVRATVPWLGEFCRRNPHYSFAEAAEALVQTLYPQRTQEAPLVSLPEFAPLPLPQWEPPPSTAPPAQSIPVTHRKRS